MYYSVISRIYLFLPSMHCTALHVWAIPATKYSQPFRQVGVHVKDQPWYETRQLKLHCFAIVINQRQSTPKLLGRGRSACISPAGMELHSIHCTALPVWAIPATKYSQTFRQGGSVCIRPAGMELHTGV